VTIRVARPDDAAAIAAIYAPIVRDTAISFETDVPDAAEMARRIETTLKTHPWLVAEASGLVAGYAYASPHRSRAAYRWDADVTVYVADTAQRRGLARGLYEEVFGFLKAQGFRSAHAGITLPNDASVGFHESLGFECVGIFRDIGYKGDRWHDVGRWALTFQDLPAPPPEPIPFADIRSDTRV